MQPREIVEQEKTIIKNLQLLNDLNVQLKTFIDGGDNFVQLQNQLTSVSNSLNDITRSNLAALINVKEGKTASKDISSHLATQLETLKTITSSLLTAGQTASYRELSNANQFETAAYRMSTELHSLRQSMLSVDQKKYISILLADNEKATDLNEEAMAKIDKEMGIIKSGGKINDKRLTRDQTNALLEKKDLELNSLANNKDDLETQRVEILGKLAKASGNYAPLREELRRLESLKEFVEHYGKKDYVPAIDKRIDIITKVFEQKEQASFEASKDYKSGLTKPS